MASVPRDERFQSPHDRLIAPGHDFGTRAARTASTGALSPFRTASTTRSATAIPSARSAPPPSASAAFPPSPVRSSPSPERATTIRLAASIA